MEEKIKKIADKFGEVYEEVEAVAKKLGCFSEKMLYGTNKPRAEFAPKKNDKDIKNLRNVLLIQPMRKKCALTQISSTFRRAT